MSGFEGVPEVYRFVGGRKRYNRQRQLAAAGRRRQVLPLLISGEKQAEIARRLGVDRATISRDARFLKELVDLVRATPGGQVTIAPGEWAFESSSDQGLEAEFQRLDGLMSQYRKEYEAGHAPRIGHSAVPLAQCGGKKAR